MEKRERRIYTVSLYLVDEWDEENEYPKNEGFLDDINGEDPTFRTTDPLQAYDRYLSRIDERWDNEMVELSVCEIVVDDEIWQELTKKESLQYSDYADLVVDHGTKVIAWEARCGTNSNYTDCFIDELLIYQSEFYNMRAVCEEAKINYATYRGYKNNGQPLSNTKKYAILKTMKEIGDRSWNNALNEEYTRILEFDKKWNSRSTGIKQVLKK